MTKIYQYHSGTHPRDAVTNSMFLIASRLGRLGLDGGIMAEHVHPDLTGKIRRFNAADLKQDDILLIHHSFSNGLIDSVAKAPCRKIMIYHNVTKPEFFGPGEEPFRQAAISGYEQLWTLRGVVDGSLGDSEFNSRALEARGFGNVETLCLLADFDNLPNRPYLGRPYHHEKDHFHILFVGRICGNKGQHHLIDAIPELERRLGRRVQLTLCGHAEHGGGYLSRLQSRMKSLGVADRVSMPGSVPNDELYGYFREADAYVSYSQHEGFGVPLIEAMALGTPVFAYGCTAITETLGGAGHVLKGLDPSELADAITGVFRTRSGLRTFIRRQRARAFDLSIEQTFPRLITFLERTYGLTLAAMPGSPEAGDKPPQMIFEGPFDGAYSLAQVNRRLALGMAEAGQMSVSARPREGVDSYVFDATELDRTPDLADILENPVSLRAPSVGLRNMYPPRTRGHVADLRLHLLYWEESRLPIDVVRQINLNLDGLLAPTRYCAKVYRDSGVRVPIRLVGQGMVNAAVRPAPAPPPDRGNAPFIFLHVSSGLARKGIEELLLAYTGSFTAEDNVVLVIKTYRNPSNVIPQIMERLTASGARLPKIVIDEKKVSDEQMADLYQLADAVVLPTRGEGFNLPAAEALKTGRLLLVTGTGAHMDFCNEDNAVLLKSRFALSQSHVAERGSYWARVDVLDLAQKMQDAAAGRLLRKAVFDYKMEDWKLVAENIASFAEELDQPRPVKDKIRLASISTYNTRCGIAAYAETLAREFPASVYEVQHWATQEQPETTHKETANVRRLWTHIGGDFEAMCRRAVDEGLDAVLIQFNFGFFEIDDFFRGIAHLARKGVLSYAIFHKTADADVFSRRVSLKDHVEGLAKLTRIFVHDVADVNYLADLGLHDTVTLMPMYILDLPEMSRTGMRKVLGLSETAPIVAHNGFLLPNKGVPELIAAFALMRLRLPQAHLILSTATFPAPESLDLAETCRELIALYKLQDHVSLITDFLSLEQIHMLLSAADLIVYPYGYSKESASASIRQGLAARRPVLGSSSPILNSARAAIDVTDKTDPERLADTMAAILESPERQADLNGRVRDFVRNQSPRDIVEIIVGNIEQDVMARDRVERPLFSLGQGNPAARAETPTVLGQRATGALLTGLLGQAPTAAQSASFNAALHAGERIEQAINGLLCSDEYFEATGADPQRLEALRLPAVDLAALRQLDGREFVDACYLRILGRKGDYGGIAHFLNMLDVEYPEAAKREIIAGLLGSDEYRNSVVPRLVVDGAQ